MLNFRLDAIICTIEGFSKFSDVEVRKLNHPFKRSEIESVIKKMRYYGVVKVLGAMTLYLEILASGI